MAFSVTTIALSGHWWNKTVSHIQNIPNQHIAEAIFDFAVNAGPVVSIKLAQATVGVEPDGVLGDTTLQKINTDDPRAFLAVFTLSKIGRYVSICEKRKESRKYFFGWVRRSLEGI